MLITNRETATVPTTRLPASDEALLGRYRQIEARTGAMLSAARDDDWQGVALREAEIRTLAHRLEREALGRALSPAGGRERLRILHRLVVADAEVRRLADPASLRLDTMFAASGRAGQRTRSARPIGFERHAA